VTLALVRKLFSRTRIASGERVVWAVGDLACATGTVITGGAGSSSRGTGELRHGVEDFSKVSCDNILLTSLVEYIMYVEAEGIFVFLFWYAERENLCLIFIGQTEGFLASSLRHFQGKIKIHYSLYTIYRMHCLCGAIKYMNTFQRIIYTCQIRRLPNNNVHFLPTSMKELVQKSFLVPLSFAFVAFF
jgi:hypothetical protein